jgi:hypothetical protein
MSDFTSGAYQSIWWKPSENQRDTLVLANIFDQPLRGAIRIFDAKGHSAAHPFTLAARETQQISVTELLSKYEITGEFGGIAIEPQDHPGYLQVMHFTMDEAAGLGALLKTMPRFPLLQKQYTIRAPMLALAHPDPALALPPETVLAPRIFLFNGTAHPVVASALVDWHSASQWGRTPLPPLTVAPGATQVLNLGERETKQLGIPPSADWASVQLSYASADSDLVAVAASLSADGKHLVQTPFSDALSWKWKGGEWMVDADHDALITAGNAGVNPARLDFKLRYGGGSQVYELPIRTLQPGEAITIDVAKIIMTQQPDRNGKVIPPSVMSGTYQFSDLDDIGMGYLYEGKQQIDKTYGHATYGCIPCCYYTDAWITDFAGKVGDSGPIPALAWESCPDGDDIVDVTSLTDTWASGNPNVATVSPDHVNAVGAGTTYSSGTSNLRILHVHNDIYTCPGAYFYPQGNINVYSTTITGADLEINNIGVTVSGPAGSSGSLSITLNGTNQHTFSYNSGSAIGPGSYQVSIPRPSLPPDTYTSLTATWAANGPISGNFSLSRPWWVLGLVRHSQYNTPYESACTGFNQLAWTYDNSCTFTAVQLKSDFVSQTEVNGTGALLHYGILKFDDGSCAGHYPPGANSSNSLRPVSSITGSCNTVLVGGDAVATNPNPVLITSYKCGDNILLVTAGNGNQALKHALDYCPACNTGYNGTNGHIDDYSSTQACSAHQVGDYGNFWTADTH